MCNYEKRCAMMKDMRKPKRMVAGHKDSRSFSFDEVYDAYCRYCGVPGNTELRTRRNPATIRISR